MDKPTNYCNSCQKPTLKSPRILIVEDEGVIAALIGGAASQAGLEYHIALTYDEAIRLLDTHEYHILWLDILLDNKHSGWEVIKHCILKEKFDGKLIICTGLYPDIPVTHKEILELSRKWFSSIYLFPKPFDLTDALALLTEYCNGCTACEKVN